MTSFLLKLFALIFMVIDHIGYFFMGKTPYYDHFRYIGRLSFPIFLFLIVVGIINSKNKEKYLIRLFFFSIITLVGNTIMTIITEHIFKIDANIFFTMFLNAFIFYLIENWKKYNKFIIILLIGVSLYLIQFVDYEYISIISAFGYYIFLKNPFKFKKTLNNILFIIYESILMVFSTVLTYYTLDNSGYVIKAQCFMVLSNLFIVFFNGKLGLKKDTKFYKFQKYFFYIFYIAHTYIFYIIKYFQIIGG